MPTNPSIALGVTPPQATNPLDMATKVLNLQDLMQQRDYRKQEIQNALATQANVQAKTEKENRDLADSALIKAAQSDGGFHTAYAKAGSLGSTEPLTTYFASKGGIQEGTASALTQHAQDIYKNSQLIGEKERSEADSDAGKIPAIVQGLDQEDDANAAAQAKAALQRLVSTAASKRTSDVLTPLIQGLSGDNVRESMSKLLDTMNVRQAFYSAGDARKKAKAEADEAVSKARTAAAGAEVAETEAPTKKAIAVDTLVDTQHLNPEQREKVTEFNREQINRDKEAAVAQQRLDIAKQEYQLSAKKFAVEYGGDVSKGWVETLKRNPNAVSEIPATLKSKVMQDFTAETGLPFPRPSSSSTQASETAARNALDNIQYINDVIKNPEIRKNLGPILGRLQEVEQHVGSAGNMSPEAEKQAQELRTRLRYFVFQEGRSLLSGRLPQNLMEQLEKSSASVHMDPNMFQGALNGANDSALNVLDNADRERFGGQMRSRIDRGLPTSTAQVADIPSHLSQSDVGKTYYSPKAKKNVKITAVNPNDPTQFRSEEVKQ